MSYLEEVLSDFRKGAKIRRKCWVNHTRGIGCEEVKKCLFNLEELCADDWELVHDDPIDWDYIIKNKCLCWFWDDDEKDKRLITLFNIDKICMLFCDDIGEAWKYCRPVRKDEVTFYEDRKDD